MDCELCKTFTVWKCCGKEICKKDETLCYTMNARYERGDNHMEKIIEKCKLCSGRCKNIKCKNCYVLFWLCCWSGECGYDECVNGGKERGVNPPLALPLSISAPCENT